LPSKRQVGGVGGDRCHLARKAVPRGPRFSDAKAGLGKIDEDDLATVRLGQAERWPARARAQIQKPDTRTQLEPGCEVIGLLAGRPAVSAIVAAAHAALESMTGACDRP
jgi:hypothetical protein